MENEIFTFVVCGPLSHSVEQHYCSRPEADRRFQALTRTSDRPHGGGDLISVSYYAASVGGLVNAWAAI